MTFFGVKSVTVFVSENSVRVALDPLTLNKKGKRKNEPAKSFLIQK